MTLSILRYLDAYNPETEQGREPECSQWMVPCGTEWVLVAQPLFPLYYWMTPYPLSATYSINLSWQLSHSSYPLIFCFKYPHPERTSNPKEIQFTEPFNTLHGGSGTRASPQSIDMWECQERLCKESSIWKRFGGGIVSCMAEFKVGRHSRVH